MNPQSRGQASLSLTHLANAETQPPQFAGGRQGFSATSDSPLASRSSQDMSQKYGGWDLISGLATLID